jgi:hypothetical protein
LLIKKGHIYFEINKTTLDIAPAKYESTVEITKLSPNGARKNKLIIKDGCFYITALNAQNALKKYLKVTGEGREQANDTFDLDMLEQQAEQWSQHN